MKNYLRSFLLLSVALSVAAAYGAPALQVSVKESSTGKMVYQGSTDAKGGFKTGNLQPGGYTIEFRTGSKDTAADQLSVALAGIKGPAKQSAISGGLAMNVQIGPASAINGKVTLKQSAAASGGTAVPAGTEKVRANVKVMNGKRYVWVPGNIDSRMGGKWVEEGSDEARLSTSNKKGGDSDFLRNRQDQSGNIGQRPDG